MKYIYITDCHWNGSEEAEDIMLFPYGDNFSTLTPEVVSELLNLRGWGFNECYWVNSSEIQYFCYEPCWISEKEESEWMKTYEQLKSGKE